MCKSLDDCYRMLDLEPGATPDEVKRSYRELAKVWHPDRFGGDPKLQAKAQEKLKQINIAYEWICKGKSPEPRRYQYSAQSRPANGQQGAASSSSERTQKQTTGQPPPPKGESSEPRRSNPSTQSRSTNGQQGNFHSSSERAQKHTSGQSPTTNPKPQQGQAKRKEPIQVLVNSIVTAIVLCVFIYGLYAIKSAPIIGWTIIAVLTFLPIVFRERLKKDVETNSFIIIIVVVIMIYIGGCLHIKGV